MAQHIKVSCRAGCRGLSFRIAASWVKRGPLRCPVCGGLALPHDAPVPVSDAPKRRRPGKPLSDDEQVSIARTVDEYVDSVIGDINSETAKLNRRATAKRRLPPPPRAA